MDTNNNMSVRKSRSCCFGLVRTKGDPNPAFINHISTSVVNQWIIMPVRLGFLDLSAAIPTAVDFKRKVFPACVGL